MRKLASIQRIVSVNPHPNADRLDLIQVLGWHLVTGKGNFKPGDLCVYFECDSILPDVPQFEFMRDRKFRVRVIKLRGETAQGLALPLVEMIPLGLNPNLVNEGDDVTELLGVKKYDPEESLNNGKKLGGDARGLFPSFIPKTDEIRMESVPRIVDEFTNRDVYFAVKMDGTSCTIYNTADDFGACSRNRNLKRPQDPEITKEEFEECRDQVLTLTEIDDEQKNTMIRELAQKAKGVPLCSYWDIVQKYDLERKLKGCGRNIAIQGEICGPGIQANRYGLKKIEFFLFDVFDIDNQSYVGYEELVAIAGLLGVKLVPIIFRGVFPFKSVDEVMECSKGFYPNGHPQEGIVIRPTVPAYSNELRGRMSVKAINPEFLLYCNL
jgi:RNA ligase (TIGR02306 family)